MTTLDMETVLNSLPARIWEASWQATLLAAVILIVQWGLGAQLSARWRNAMWLLVYARLLLPSLPHSRFSAYNWLPAKVPAQPSVAQQPAIFPGSAWGTAIPSRARAEEVEKINDAPPPGHALQPPIVPASSSSLPLLALLWLAGTFVTAAWSVLNYVRLRKRVKRLGWDVPGSLRDQFAAAKTLLCVKHAELMVSEAVSTPSVTGFWKGKVMLPVGLETNLRPEDIRMVLLHELAHVKRGDLRMAWLSSLAATLHWFNPAIRFAMTRSRKDREMACDEWVLRFIADRKGYGAALLRFLEFCQDPPQRLGLGIIGVFENKNNMVQRIRRIATYHRPTLLGSAVGGAVMATIGVLALTGATGAQDFTYTTDNGKITITRSKNAKSASEVNIPDTINGLPVTAISDYAFENLGSDLGPTKVTIGKNVTLIGKAAFARCTRLASVNIPNGVTSIGDGAFEFCTKLPGVNIPASVTHIGDHAFSACFSMTGIAVDPHNPAYCSVDGVLYNKNQTTLIQYPAGKRGSFKIPATVTDMRDYALWNCPELTSVMIPDGITRIQKEAFAACGRLVDVYVPKSVTSIGVFAFDSCVSLKAVYFSGNAPKLDGPQHAFNGDNAAVVYHLPGATGWGRKFDGLPTAEWKPAEDRDNAPESQPAHSTPDTTAPNTPAGGGAIYDAARDGDLGRIKALLKKNPRLAFGTNSNDSTPLHMAALHGRKDAAELLLANKAYIDARDDYGATPLDLAADAGHKDVVELLITNKADINARDNFGRTPLYAALEKGHGDVAKLLIANKADVNIPTNEGDAPLHEAALSGDNAVAELLVAAKAAVNAKDELGRTPLHLAAAWGRKDVAELLLGNGADVNAMDITGHTALREAVERGKKNLAEFLRQRGGHE